MLIRVVKNCLAGKTNGSHCTYFVPSICMVMVLVLVTVFSLVADYTDTTKEPAEGSSPVGQRKKRLQFPSVIPATWNAGIVLVTAGFQSTLKCNWTLERQTEKGRHCQGQSLAWHAIATCGLIDLYKAPPPPPCCHSVSLI